MKKLYQLSPRDLEEILTSHFLMKGEKVNSCDFNVSECDDRLNYPKFTLFEVVVHVEDLSKEKNGT